MGIRVFFDMDGVLVDFAGGAVRALSSVLAKGDASTREIRKLIDHKGPREEITTDLLELITTKKDAKQPRSQWERYVNNAVFSVVGKIGQAHWEQLSPNPGYRKMLDAASELVGTENVHVLTSPIRDKNGGCERGKRSWIAMHTNVPDDRVFVTTEKATVAAGFPGDICILVDDRTKYCEEFEAVGGIAIRHEPPADLARAKLTIRRLGELVRSLEGGN